MSAPRSREKHVTNNSKGVAKTGSGTHGGKVGSGGYFEGGGKGSQRAGGTTRSPISIIIIIIALLFGGGGGLFSSMSSNSMPSTTTTNLNGASGSSRGWRLGNNTGNLNTSIVGGTRKKYTTLKGNGKDEMTLMVYMCGTDLESRSGMATSDLNEMLKATTTNSKLHILVYTGGCARWKNNVISSSYNQIYAIENGRFVTKVNNDGAKAMTSPSTLTGFINWCNKNYPTSNRKALILWDHGGGSISGYGYDEKYRTSGTMTLSALQKALKATNTKFDFIGFDACLMATVENGLMLNDFADYMIASEETEPGIGWYYTNWVSQLNKNTSINTLELGKMIADDFVAKCATSCAGQLTTLSVVDLAELAATVPDVFKNFAASTRSMISNSQYKTVSSARNNAREFSRTARVDQIDLADFATILGEDEGKELSDVLLSAIKYNKTSANMTNAYGLSVYFPYTKVNKVDTMVNTYKAIGMDAEYTKCIQEFAKVEVTGQAASQSTGNPYQSLFGNNTSPSQSTMTEQAIETLLQSFLTGNYGTLSGYSSSNSHFLTGRSIDDETIANYVAENQFDTSELQWNGTSMKLSKANWELVEGLELNMFYDDGEGYIELGLDNIYDIDGRTLKGSDDRTWLAINGQPVAYYHTQTFEDGDNYTIMGRVPCLLNGTRVDLILIFDQDNPHGYIAGARLDYGKKVDTQARGLIELQKGDKLKFLCDYYSYDGDYIDTYYLGETMRVTSKMEISNVDVGDGDVFISYRFTDLYNNHFWTPALTLSKQ
ncbi:MAG: hypothetical protein J6P61_00925 [Erysipelotrichaceae bacterium]|nr:hypothetical protein [Erysipelotrichaceae bacterium]